MESAILQDWVTIRATGNVTVAQGEPFWLDVSAYRDAIAWLHVAEVYVSGGDVTVRLSYQSAPVADEALFSVVGGPVTLSSNAVTVTQMLGSIANPPLARFFRWRLSVSGATSSTWDATFRIFVALNRPGYRTPAALPTALGAPSLSSQAVALKAPEESAFGYKPFSGPKVYSP